MSIASALTDVKDAIKSGQPLTDSLIAEIATDYSLNPLLLKRKIEENKISVETVTAFVSATEVDLEKRFYDKFIQICKNYNVNSYHIERHPEFFYKGERYIAICKSGRTYVTMSFKDFKVWNFNIHTLNQSDIVKFEDRKIKHMEKK
jgi:hypothetical protein